MNVIFFITVVINNRLRKCISIILILIQQQSNIMKLLIFFLFYQRRLRLFYQFSEIINLSFFLLIAAHFLFKCVKEKTFQSLHVNNQLLSETQYILLLSDFFS